MAIMGSEIQAKCFKQTADTEAEQKKEWNAAANKGWRLRELAKRNPLLAAGSVVGGISMGVIFVGLGTIVAAGIAAVG